jgi:microcystin-dependent protein
LTTPLESKRTALPRRDFLGRILLFLGGTASMGWTKPSNAEVLGTEPFLGEIMLFAGAFAPRGWALCNGQLLPINQNQALFAILGTTYGGNGQTTFALPNLRGRVPIHFGQGPGLALRTLGEVGGEEAHTVTLAEMPAHGHVARGSSAAGTSASPAGMFPAQNASHIPRYLSTADTTLAATAIANTGGSQPHENRQPYTVLNYVICLQGIFPSQ